MMSFRIRRGGPTVTSKSSNNDDKGLNNNESGPNSTTTGNNNNNNNNNNSNGNNNIGNTARIADNQNNDLNEQVFFETDALAFGGEYSRLSSCVSADNSSISTHPSFAASTGDQSDPNETKNNKKKKKKKKSKADTKTKKVKVNISKFLSDNVDELRQELERTQINHFHLGREYEELTKERTELESKVELQEQTIETLRRQLESMKGRANNTGDDSAAELAAQVQSNVLDRARQDRDKYRRINEDLRASVARLEMQVRTLSNEINDRSADDVADQCILLRQERDRTVAAEAELADAHEEIRLLRRERSDLQQALDDNKELEKEVVMLRQDLEDCAAEYEEEIAALEGVNARLKEMNEQQSNEILFLKQGSLKVSQHNESVTSATASMSSAIVAGFLDNEDSSDSSFHDASVTNMHRTGAISTSIETLKAKNEALQQETNRLNAVEQTLRERNATQLAAYSMLEDKMKNAVADADKREDKLIETIREQKSSLSFVYKDLVKANNNVQELEAKIAILEAEKEKTGGQERLNSEKNHPTEYTSTETSLGYSENTTRRSGTDMSDNATATAGVLSQHDMLASVMKTKKPDGPASWFGSVISSVATAIESESYQDVSAAFFRHTQERCSTLEQENLRLRSSLVRLQSYHKGIVYQHEVTVRELRSTNEILSAKITDACP